MILNCLIVDDEPDARKLLEEYISDVSFLHLSAMAEHPVRANTMLSELVIDLMFLDINMPKMSGLAFLRSLSAVPPTILTTAYSEYAVDGFDLDVVDYLVKPFSFDRFLKACNKAKDYYQAKEDRKRDADQPFFFVKCDGRLEKVLFDDLVYIEAMSNYVILHTESRKLIVYHTIKGLSEQMPSGRFLKIHKSTIINVGKIKSISGNEVDLGKARVIISQNLHDEVMKEILKDRMLKR